MNGYPAFDRLWNERASTEIASGEVSGVPARLRIPRISTIIVIEIHVDK